jgi:hypothetical protein
MAHSEANPSYEDHRAWGMALTDLAERPVSELDHHLLDRHLDLDHDRDSGERGIGPAGAIREHEKLHRRGIWSERPHRHGGTLPFGADDAS